MSKKHETDIIICLDYYTNLNHEIINFVSWRTCVAFNWTNSWLLWRPAIISVHSLLLFRHTHMSSIFLEYNFAELSFPWYSCIMVYSVYYLSKKPVWCLDLVQNKDKCYCQSNAIDDVVCFTLSMLCYWRRRLLYSVKDMLLTTSFTLQCQGYAIRVILWILRQVDIRILTENWDIVNKK